jgi:hypothetical protein
MLTRIEENWPPSNGRVRFIFSQGDRGGPDPWIEVVEGDTT